MRQIAPIFFTLLLLPFLAHGASVPLSLSTATPLQEDTVAITLGTTKDIVKSATFGGTPVSFFPLNGKFISVIGIAPTKSPAYYRLRVNLADGTQLTRLLLVKKRLFPKVVLGIPEELGLTPSGLVTKLADTKVDIEKIVTVQTPTPYFKAPFGLPLSDNTHFGSTFGEIRQTGQNQIRHLGVDFSAASGTPVAAMNAGVVRKVYFDTVNGNTIIIDHGEGIYSLYLHLDKMLPKEGDSVMKGQVIGTVGMTGYTTGPHLHLSVKVNDVPVDPLKFIKATTSF